MTPVRVLSLSLERDLGSLILATDISRQNDYLSRFRLHLDQSNLCLSNASHRHFVLQVLLLSPYRNQVNFLGLGAVFDFFFFCDFCSCNVLT